jgi:hypothetical protein
LYRVCLFERSFFIWSFVRCLTVTVGVNANRQETIPALPERAKKKLLTQLKKFANIYDPTSPIAYTADMAFPANEHLAPITEFATLGGMTDTRRTGHDEIFGIGPAPGAPVMDNKLERSFDVEEIRRAFLRFWVALLGRYRNFMIPDEETKSTLSPISPLSPSPPPMGKGISAISLVGAAAVAAAAATAAHNPKKTFGNPPIFLNNVSFIRDSDEDERPLVKGILDTQVPRRHVELID